MTEQEQKKSNQPEIQQVKLSVQQIYNLLERHKKTIQESFSYDLSGEDEYFRHAAMIKKIGDNYLSKEFRDFEIDDKNKQVLRFLLYYFNNCKEAESVFPDRDYKIHKNLLIIGEPGTGKTLLMQIFSDYLNLTCNPNRFNNLSVTEMMNYYKFKGHIDRFTYNEEAGKGSIEGHPLNVCLNDIGLQTENQKSFGTSLDTVIDEFLYARYEIYQSHQKKYHLTSNLSVDDFKDRFGDRLIDRFKSFNVIPLTGETRRR